jgi:hypothetical protein
MHGRIELEITVQRELKMSEKIGKSIKSATEKKGKRERERTILGAKNNYNDGNYNAGTFN